MGKTLLKESTEAVPPLAQTPPERVSLSVVIPAYNARDHLEACLQALEASAFQDFEVLVVDDCSTDDTVEVARRHGARPLSLDSRSGPAVARNRGAAEARHPYIFFLDADVVVAPESLGQIAEVFASDPSIDALFGSYDREPGAPNALSQYRNLLHHWVHQTSNKEARSFWTGCGAIKKSVFLDIGGFNVAYDQPCIEDIEFGARLRRAGYRVVLSKQVQVKHMKRWTLWSMIRCDVLQRGIPWARLLLREGHIPNDLNLRHSQRLSAVLALGLVAMLLVGSWYYRSLLLVPLVVLLAIVTIDHWTTREPISKRSRILLGVTLGATLVAMFALMAAGHNLIQLWTLLGLACLAGILILNLRFYLFFAEVKSPLFVLLVIPLHTLYFLYSSFSFAAAAVLHMGEKVSSRRAPLEAEKKLP